MVKVAMPSASTLRRITSRAAVGVVVVVMSFTPSR